MEEVLIARLKEKDETAITQLYDMYSASLYGVIIRIVKDKMLAEEVMQDCFVKIWYSFIHYEKEKGRLYTWVVSIARNLAIDKVRSRAYRQGLQNRDLSKINENSIGAIVTHQPEYFDIKGITATLAPEQKQVIDLLYFEGFSQSGAAKALAIPLGTVKTRVRYALKNLRTLIIEPKLVAA